MDESLNISFGSRFQALNDSWIERVFISIDACWYLNKFIWITVSSSGARDNEMLQTFSAVLWIFCRVPVLFPLSEVL